MKKIGAFTLQFFLEKAEYYKAGMMKVRQVFGEPLINWHYTVESD